jgi:hypothetical protein
MAFQKINACWRSSILPPLLVVLVFFTALALSPFLSGCATRSAPSGGAKDSTAARLDTSFPPNNSTYFKAKEINLQFNEYIKLKSPQQQILISPPLAKPLEIEAGAKDVTISLQDSLRANTTYIISFGEGVTDYTEGNVTKNLKYVFSTGSYIDSLEISGSIKQAYSGEAEQDLLVALYAVNQIEKPDSFLYQQLPNYYASLTEAGTFEMTNLKAGLYRLVAFADRSGTFKLSTGQERFAFWPKVIDLQPDSNYNFKLKSYQPKPAFRFYNARHRAKGKINFAFSAAADSFTIEPLNIPPDSSFFEPNPRNDTIAFWFRSQADSALFKINGPAIKDSVLTVFLRKYRKPKLKLTPKSTQLRARDTLTLISNLPLLNFAKKGVYKLAKDTVPVALQLDSNQRFRAFLHPPFKNNFTLKIKQNAVQSWFNPNFDSATYNFTALAADDLGTLNFTVKADSGFAYLLTLTNQDGLTLKEEHFTDSTTVQLKNYPPGKLKAFLVQDLNEDKTYTPGNYYSGRLPEPRIQYKESIEIRANWELELLWQVKPLGN